MNLIALRTNFI